MYSGDSRVGNPFHWTKIFQKTKLWEKILGERWFFTTQSKVLNRKCFLRNSAKTPLLCGGLLVHRRVPEYSRGTQRDLSAKLSENSFTLRWVVGSISSPCHISDTLISSHPKIQRILNILKYSYNFIRVNLSYLLRWMANIIQNESSGRNTWDFTKTTVGSTNRNYPSLSKSN